MATTGCADACGCLGALVVLLSVKRWMKADLIPQMVNRRVLAVTAGVFACK